MTVLENNLENKIENKKESGNNSNNFSLAKRAKSFAYAGRGLRLFMKSTHNAWIHTFVFIVAVAAGAYFHISRMEWVAVILASGLVLVAEAFNTAIEIDINLTSPEYHPYAKNTKDVAAGAVLISAIAAAIVGILVFYPYIFG